MNDSDSQCEVSSVHADQDLDWYKVEKQVRATADHNDFIQPTEFKHWMELKVLMSSPSSSPSLGPAADFWQKEHHTFLPPASNGFKPVYNQSITLSNNCTKFYP